MEPGAEAMQLDRATLSLAGRAAMRADEQAAVQYEQAGEQRQVRAMAATSHLWRRAAATSAGSKATCAEIVPPSPMRRRDTDTPCSRFERR